ncbi:MAG: DUF4163 domain-containing protein [Saprospiraceae bacterium]|nr:DUF4163 domain-containing protein [Saprospiraceae bacterium]
MRKYIPILISLCCLFGCKKGKIKLESEKGLKVRFEIQNFQDKKGQCEKQDGECAQIEMVYPTVVEGSPILKQTINDSIFSFLIQTLVFEEYNGGSSLKDLQIASQSFLNEWQRANAEMPGNTANSNWEVSVTGQVGLHTPKMATITLGSYSYAGGAHPNSFVSVLNFNLKTGKTLVWQDFVTDMKALKALAEKEFKKARELPLNADLVEEGYFWEGNFELPKNFELQEEGIYFWYNPFEVASYAQGPTDFTISYEDLGKLVRKEVIF